MSKRDELSPLFSWRGEIARSGLASTVKLVAFALSLHMNEAGGSCFPAVSTLMKETSLTRRSVQNALAELKRLGWLMIERSEGGVHTATNRYQAEVPPTPLPLDESTTCTGASDARGQDVRPTGASDDTGRAHQMRPKTTELLEDVTEDVSLARPSSRKRDELWDALAEVFEPQTGSERSLVGKARRELAEVGATPEEIKARAVEAWQRWQRPFKPQALVSNWTSLGRKTHGSSIRDSFARYRQLYGRQSA